MPACRDGKLFSYELSMLTAIPHVSNYDSEEVNMLKLLATNSNLHTELKEARILAAQPKH